MKKIIIILLSFMLFSCGSTYSVRKKSNQFAHFEKNKKVYKSISSDDVRILIYSVDSESKENNVAELWMNEIILTLESKNYKLLSNDVLKIDNGDNFSIAEFEVYYNSEVYRYLVSVLPHGDKIYVAESSGKKEIFIKRKEEILKIIKSIEY